ncbi:LOW QUALITY PROTEIN: glucosamine inositolphosphorylceramide transferase 1-like [Rutidosis leptorrhynchoides]|uniref:LOW QUALITY PROTEIN: glucosamine inositolphosphorylceramide transferase 1-like n=1 Tax=Rutidosis leptorrhynchoides TaxID=125765 RepID=UPI003A99CEFF
MTLAANNNSGGGGSGCVGSGGGVNGGCVVANGKWHRHQGRRFVVFFISCFALYSVIAGFYIRVMLKPHFDSSSVIGCQEDNEGSWSIGVLYGQSPFSLKPIEDVNVWRDESAAWPVANPVLTCASVSGSGYPSNFVADPFLYVQGDTFYLFYETKNSITMQGDIGFQKARLKGVTWEQLGIVLDEDWHLSFPYVFNYLGQIYMMPEGRQKGEVRVYRAVDFPMRWTLEKIVLRKPLIDAFSIYHDDQYYLFGTDDSGFGAKKNGELEIWYASSPLGPFKPHKRNPIYNIDKSSGARNGGRPFVYNGNLYRVGQDCGETYGHRTRVFRVEILTKDEYREVEVPISLVNTNKSLNAWNGARYHHLDVQQLSSGEWIGFMDGDRVPSGDPSHRFVLGWASFAAAIFIVMLLGLLVGAVNCIIPLNWCAHYSGKRTDSSLVWERSNYFSSKLRIFCSRLNRAASFIQGKIKPSTYTGRTVIFMIFIIGATLMCSGVKSIFGGSGAEEPYQFKGHFSQFTLVTMTYDARLWNLKMYVKHYSRCSSVKEIVVIWNKGIPPKLSDLDSAVPVRIRIEEWNSLNNRFKQDPLINTRAVLELDDDIMMSCDDIERGFRVWRKHPDRIVGFYPRLVDSIPLTYRAEKYARSHKGYNIILTGAAFIDTQFAFTKYWSDEAKAGRDLVDEYFNCEDVLLNYLYANSSSTRTVEYVRPPWAIDTSKFSGVAISRNTDEHYKVRSNCLQKLSEMYGSLLGRKNEFNGRKDGWDL